MRPAELGASVVALFLAVGPAPALASEDVLELESLSGAPLRLVRQDQRVLLLHFWASWCPSCVEELPLLDAAAARCREQGLRAYAVNVDEDVETIRGSFVARGGGLVVVRDPRGAVWRAASGVGLPANLVWTASESRVSVGPRTRDEWESELAALGCPAPPD